MLHGLIRGSGGAQAGKGLLCWLCCVLVLLPMRPFIQPLSRACKPSAMTCAASVRQPGQLQAVSMLHPVVKKT